MKLDMMHSIGLVFVDSFLVYGLLRGLIQKITRAGSKKGSLILVLGLVSLALIVAHYAAFDKCVKERNYFDQMEVDRVYTSDILGRRARQVLSVNHPDRGGDITIFNKLTNVRDILLDKDLAGLYDKFGEFKEVEEKKNLVQLESQLRFAAVTEMSAFFAVTLVVSIVCSYGTRFSKYRILSVLLIGGLLAQEFLWMGSDEEIAASLTGKSKSNGRKEKFEVQADFYDQWLPRLALFERVILIRMMFVAILTALRLFFDLTIAEHVNQFDKKFDDNLENLKSRLDEQIKVFLVPAAALPGTSVPAPPEQRVFNLDEFIKNTEFIKEVKKIAEDQQKSEPKDGKAIALVKKAVQFSFFGLFLYQVFSKVFDSDEPAVSQ